MCHIKVPWKRFLTVSPWSYGRIPASSNDVSEGAYVDLHLFSLWQMPDLIRETQSTQF